MFPSLRFASFLGLRFGLSTRHKGFLTVVSMISLVGMVLGVCALIVVLSVMNGFHHELRDRLLVLVPQWRVMPQHGLLMQDPQRIERKILSAFPAVTVSPYIESTVLLSSDNAIRGVHLLGILPEREQGLLAYAPDIARQLQPGAYQVALGQGVARQLGVRAGDRVALVLPSVAITPAGVFPRTKFFTVQSVFATGSQVDAEYAVIHLGDAQRLFRAGQSVQGLRLNGADDPRAGAFREKLGQTLAGESMAMADWRSLQGPLFDAVQMEKRMIALLLFIVIVVAAFNIISVVTISVTQKRPAIAILRTMGATRGTVLRVFLVQGMVLGVTGITLGTIAGLLLAQHINGIIHTLEAVSGSHLFDPSVFYIVDLPVAIQPVDVLGSVTGALLLALVSSLIPAWHASRVDPAVSLRAL